MDHTFDSTVADIDSLRAILAGDGYTSAHTGASDHLYSPNGSANTQRDNCSHGQADHGVNFNTCSRADCSE